MGGDISTRSRIDQINEAKARVLDVVLIDWLGGQEVVDMLVQSDIEGRSYRELERRFDMPFKTIQRRVVAARIKLRRAGLIPDYFKRNQDVRDHAAKAYAGGPGNETGLGPP